MNETKVLKGTPKHLSRTGELNSFTYLMLNLPYKCNFRCAKCFNLDNDAPRKYENVITLEDRLKLIKEAKQLGGRVVVFAGEGEPSLDENIKVMVESVHNNGMIPIIYSNGSIITDELIDFYKKNNVSMVFAFDTLDPIVFAMKTKAKDMFARVVINITKTIESFKDKTYYENGMRVLNVAVNTTVSDLNVNDLFKIKSLWEKNAYFICNPVVKLGNAVSNWEYFRGLNQYSDEFINNIVQRNSESGGPLTLGSDGLCGYSRWGIAVCPSGDYMTCAYTTQTNEILGDNDLLGNIKTTSLRKAFEYKHEVESEHYKIHGVAPCLIRMPSFKNYLQMIKSS